MYRVCGKFFTLNRNEAFLHFFAGCLPLGGETRIPHGYTSVTSLLSTQTHDLERSTALTINSQGNPKHLDRAGI